MRKTAICDMSDEFATASVLGGKFEREDCGFFEECTHQVEHYDMTVSGGPTSVQIWYCAIDWKKVGPIILCFILLMWYVFRRVHQARSAGAVASSGYKKYYNP